MLFVSNSKLALKQTNGASQYQFRILDLNTYIKMGCCMIWECTQYLLFS
jgi:hypothetical protein